MSGIVEVQITDLKINHFVRKELNQDRVLFFAELIESGEELNPIEITPNNEVIDGRHRVEAHAFFDRESVRAKVVRVSGQKDLIARAYKSNSKGSLPPSRQDTEHTVALLVGLNETAKNIADLLGIPAKIARQYAREVRAKIQRFNMQKAVKAVTEGGLTVQESAEAHKVDLKKLQEHLDGKRRPAKYGIPDVKSASTRSYKSIASKNASILRKLFDKYEDGDVTEAQVLEIIKHLEGLQKKQARSMADWRKRFEAKKKGADGA